MNYKKYKSKKFLIALALIACTTYLGQLKIGESLTPVMSGMNIMVLFGLIGSLYGFANVASKNMTDPSLLGEKQSVSRKFVVAMCIIGCSTYLAGLGYMDGNNIMAVFALVAGGYGGANILEKKIELLKINDGIVK